MVFFLDHTPLVYWGTLPLQLTIVEAPSSLPDLRHGQGTRKRGVAFPSQHILGFHTPARVRLPDHGR